MKVIAINGSPHSEGNTFQLLRTAADVLAQHGIETEIVQVGHLTLAGCQSCGGCAARHDGRCALPDDGLNAILAKMGQADGILLGSPVHYAGISGADEMLSGPGASMPAANVPSVPCATRWAQPWRRSAAPAACPPSMPCITT